MFKDLKKFLEKYISENENISIEEIDIVDQYKMSVSINYADIKIISIELLPNGICDLMTINIETEDILKSKTIKFENSIIMEEELINYFTNI
ncbi:hypothetical protein VB796_01765 [Arcicella sp. LKC2W]|uniref:hypothetical protein n=1 Tax=Arcicella sp. LKC2W TaxID=2984198 RepID=UPI002B1FDA77|nr:hypothetical protein [Arcicella sp. LKC2W]MEA5457744.1 hypothetical protein [Arcicella sp. LKC2W]